MRILLSNDDGILAPGLAALHAAVSDLGDVTVVAPDSPQSAAGHAITLQRPIAVRRVHVGGESPFVGTSVDGRPADCVRLAIRQLMHRPPDLVLAGINTGANVGINVFYSGTVAAAAEAAMYDIPGVAFSATMAEDVNFPKIAKVCRWVLGELLGQGLKRKDLINVNIPALGPGRPRGVRVVGQSIAELEDVYHRHVDDEGRETFRLGDVFDFGPGQDDTDVAALADGFITITPLHVDRTDRKRMADLKQRSWDKLP